MTRRTGKQKPRKDRFEIPKAELQELSDLHSDANIGRLFGVSAEVIRQRRLEHGINPGKRRSFDPPRDKLESLYQKHSIRQIAEQYHVGETVVWNRLKEHGIILEGYERGGHRLKPGKKFSSTHLENMRKAAKARRGKFVGPKSPSWKGGLTEANLQARRSGAYREWKKTALENAGYKCEQCGVENRFVCKCCGTRVSLHVHHIKPFAEYPDLRFDPDNAQVLCPKCHKCHH